MIAYLKGMILYVANGEKWDKSIEDFVRWSLQYDLWCKIRFFGSMIEDAENAESMVKHTGPRNLLDLLPEIFTREEAGLLRQRQGIVRGLLSLMLSNWKGRGYIEPLEEVQHRDIGRQRFCKTAAYLKKHPGV